MYKNYLLTALKRLFLDKSQLGFWDEESGRIIERLYHDKNWNWKYVDNNQYRYGVFCLSCLLLSKKYTKLDLNSYNEKIQLYLNFILRKLNNLAKTDLTYGALLALTLGNEFGLINIDNKIIEKKLVETCDYAINSFDNQNALILIPISIFLSSNISLKLKSKFEKLIQKYLISIDKNGLFQTGDLRYCYHQRLMYTLWGLIHSSRYYYTDEIYNAAKKTLSYVWNTRRQSDTDNAFLWHPQFYLVKNRIKYIPLPIINIKSSRYLFECHQTFFANAINFFNNQFNEKFMIEERDKAISWIFGENRMNLDLTKITNLDIPCRIMSKNKNLFIAGENYKGSYEIGSYILALSFYL